MSDPTPPVPPLPSQSADEAARAKARAEDADTAPAYSVAADPDDTGVPTSLRGDVDDIGRGFFSALFDLSFRTFITRRLASVFYFVGLVAIAIGFLVSFIGWIVRGAIMIPFNLGGGISLIVSTLIVVPIVTFLAIIVLRFVIESVVALIAIAENTQRTAENTAGDSARS